MIQFILEALWGWKTNGIVIVNSPQDNNLSIETMDGNVFVQVTKEMNTAQVLDLCGIDTDAVTNHIGEHIATKMCNLVNQSVGNMVTRLDVQGINSGEIEKVLHAEKESMLEYIAGDFINADKIKDQKQ